MENQVYSWENSLFLWQFSVAILTSPDGTIPLIGGFVGPLRSSDMNGSQLEGGATHWIQG